METKTKELLDARVPGFSIIVKQYMGQLCTICKTFGCMGVWENPDENYKNMRCRGECNLPLYPFIVGKYGDLMDYTITCKVCKHLVCYPCMWSGPGHLITCFHCRRVGSRKDYFESYPELCNQMVFSSFSKSLRQKQLKVKLLCMAPLFASLPQELKLNIFYFV